MSNPNCDKGDCVEDNGPVKRYPLGGNAALILCRYCWERENRYRSEMRVDLENSGTNLSHAEILKRWPNEDWEKAEEAL